MEPAYPGQQEALGVKAVAASGLLLCGPTCLYWDINLSLPCSSNWGHLSSSFTTSVHLLFEEHQLDQMRTSNKMIKLVCGLTVWTT